MTKSKELSNIFEVEKFFSKIHVNKENECWIWCGAVNKSGYGAFYHKPKTHRAHRVAFVIFNGKTKEGMVLDHICRNRSCVNPDHLREVDCKTNTTENSKSFGHLNKIKTHCKRGHEFTKENTIIVKTGRQCRECRLIHRKLSNSKRPVRKRRSGTLSTSQIIEMLKEMEL